jgi:hypothetical protein
MKAGSLGLTKPLATPRPGYWTNFLKPVLAWLKRLMKAWQWRETLLLPFPRFRMCHVIVGKSVAMDNSERELQR